MKKRIVFEFDENSITEATQADIEAVITLPDGRVIVLPKLRGAIECAPRGAEGLICPRCGAVMVFGGCLNCILNARYRR